MLADLRRRVAALLDRYCAAQAEPRAYFPKTSWIAATQPGDIARTWQGGYASTGERDYAPGYARLLAGDEDFASGTTAVAALTDHATRLHELITLPTAVASA
jgi:exodeoxyribonuclease V gamma subunit